MHTTPLRPNKPARLARWIGVLAAAVLAACSATQGQPDEETSKSESGVSCFLAPSSNYCQTCKNLPQCWQNQCLIYPNDPEIGRAHV